MKLKITEILLHNKIHERERSHDMCIIKIKDSKVRLTYEAYNAVERFNGEIFDGVKWNNVFHMIDLGVLPESSYYIKDESIRIKRVQSLTVKANEYLNTIL